MPIERQLAPQPERLHLSLIPLAALIATLPLIVHGCSCGHDFDFHLLSWFEAATQFANGNLHPHWAFTPAYNAGEPRFVFYPPISWYLGATLGLLLTHLPGVSEAAGWTATPIFYTWICLALSGLTMHRLARAFASPNAAILAATLYLANPYMLFTAYERTAYAELLAAAWIPLMLFAILRERVTIAGIAVPLTLLWLTNAPAAVMGTYTLALLAAVRLCITLQSNKRGALPLALKTVAGTVIGLALAAFYILPAAYERRYVQISMATIAGMGIPANFLFEHTGTTSDNLIHDEVLHTVSLIAVILLATTVIALTTSYLRRFAQLRPRFPIVSLSILTAAIAFLLTPLSLPIWNHTPQVTFLQFPWRLLAVLAPVLALTLASVFARLHFGPVTATVATVAIAAALVFPAYHSFSQSCDPEDTAPARIALFHSHIGTDTTDEYTPINASNDALAPPNSTDPDDPHPSNYPPYWLADSPDARPTNAAIPGTAPTHLTLNLPHPEDLILNLRDYPAWHIDRVGEDMEVTPITQRLQRPDGLIAISLPAGPSNIDIRYTRTPDQTLGDALTLVALPIFLVILRRQTATSGEGSVAPGPI